ncbi:MAG: cyclic nucleotide-binding domain-containing protein [Thermoanaerobaculia bacterium]
MKEDLQEKALKLEIKGNYEEAAKLYLQAGRYEKAAFMYQKLNKIKEALEVLKEAMLFDKAAELALKNDFLKDAASLFEKAGKLDRAAECYEKTQDNKKAAELYEKIGKRDKAAEVYFKTGNYLKAGSLWEELNKEDKAIQAYKQYLAESVGRAQDLSSKDAQRIAKIFIKIGDQIRAAEIYLRIKEPLKAFLLLLEAGIVEKAVEIYQNQLQGQAYSILNLIASENALNSFGDVCMKTGEYPVAALAFEKCGNILKAAEAHMEAKDFLQAAEYFMKAGSYLKAAELYEASGQYDHAADLYYKLKKFEKAALCYEKEGDFYKAGRLYQYLGQNQKAIQLLQKVSSEDPEYIKASMLICKAFNQVGLPEMALKRFEEIRKNYTINEQTLEVFYDFAEILLSMEEIEKAKEIYTEIINIDFAYKDVSQKLKRLTAREIKKPPKEEKPPIEEKPLLKETPQVQEKPQKVERKTKAIQALKKFPFFQNFNEEELNILWNTIDRKEVEEGTFLLEPGKYADGFFLLVQGRVELLTPMGRSIKTVEEPGALLGIAAFFSGETSAIGIKAIKPSKVVIVKGREVLKMAQENEEFSKKLKSFLTISLEKEISLIPTKTPYHMQILEAKKKLL